MKARFCAPGGTRNLEIWYNTGMREMCMLDEVRAKRDGIYAVARRHEAEKLWCLGSCARKEVSA